MGARAARAGVMLREVDTLANLRAIVAKAVWQHAQDHDYLTELADVERAARIGGGGARAEYAGV